MARRRTRDNERELFAEGDSTTLREPLSSADDVHAFRDFSLFQAPAGNRAAAEVLAGMAGAQWPTGYGAGGPAGSRG